MQVLLFSSIVAGGVGLCFFLIRFLFIRAIASFDASVLNLKNDIRDANDKHEYSLTKSVTRLEEDMEKKDSEFKTGQLELWKQVSNIKERLHSGERANTEMKSDFKEIKIHLEYMNKFFDEFKLLTETKDKIMDEKINNFLQELRNIERKKL